MKHYKLIAFATATLAFGMLTACGEGFKGNNIVAQRNFEQIQRGEEDITPGNTVPSVDEQAVSGFVAERNQTGNAANASLAGQIEALSMTRTEVDTGSGMDVTYRVRMLFGCDANEEIVVSRMLDTDRLRAGDTLSLGRNSTNTYEFLLACTDAECSEAVVTVRSIDPTGVNALVHYGMIDEGQVSSDLGGRMRVYEYTTRQSNAENFYTEATVAWYREQCLLSDAEAQLGEGLSSGGGINGDIFGGTGNGTGGADSPLFGGSDDEINDLFF